MKTTVRWDEFDQLTERLENAVKRCEPLTDLDWALFCFSPKSPGPVISSGRASIFSIVSGLTDDEAIKLLRSVQRKNSSRRRADLLFPGVPARAQSRNSDVKARGMATPKRGMENQLRGDDGRLTAPAWTRSR